MSDEWICVIRWNNIKDKHSSPVMSWKGLQDFLKGVMQSDADKVDRILIVRVYHNA